MPYGYVDQDALVRSAKGNASWNPMSPDIDWGSWLGAMNQNLQSGQDRKRALQMESDTNKWANLLNSLKVRQAEKNLNAPVEPLPEIYNAPEKALRKAGEYFGYDMSDVAGWSPSAKQDLIKAHTGALEREKINKILYPQGHVAKEDKPSDFDKKVSNARASFKAGKLTQEQLTQVETGYPLTVTPVADKRIRQKIDLDTRKALSNARGTKKIDEIESIKNDLGLDLTMPEKYNLSQKRVEGDVGDDEDFKTINKYDAMFKFFWDNLHNKVKFKDFFLSPTARDKDIDVDAIKKWYDIYD